MNTLRTMLFRGAVTSDALTHSLLKSRVTTNAFLFGPPEFIVPKNSGLDPGGYMMCSLVHDV